jgi:rhamnogalacturonyl hydrolase YesR
MTKNWLLNSGIFMSDSSNTNFGGVHSFYDEKTKEFAFLYPEITGYYASTMRFLYEHEKNEQYIHLAKASCNWLINLYKNFGGIIQGISPQGNPKKYVYSFDTAICSKGLLDCYMISKDNKFLEYAQKLNNWILSETIENDGIVKPVKNLETNKFEINDKVWYKKPGSLHIKLTIPLLQLYKITKDETSLNAAKKIANSIIHFQQSDGSILLHKDSKVINIHTMLYALEGILHAYNITKNQIYLNSCKKAVDWCENQIQSDGSIDLWFNSKHHSKSSYPIAQLIRIKILLAKLEQKNLDQTISKLQSFLLSLQAQNEDNFVNGGFYEEFRKSIFGWKKNLKVNSWASMFSLQALYWLDNFSDLDFEKEVELLY